MTNQALPEERYQQVDLPFYRERVAPLLPPQVLDFHVHAWKSEQWKYVPWQTDAAGAKYLVTVEQYGVERLLADGEMLFPDRPFQAVCFGYPTPAADLQKTNDYLAAAARHAGLFPLLLTGKDKLPPAHLEAAVRERGFFGYKVLLDWFGNDYGSVNVEQMIGPQEMVLADELGLIVMLHVPRAGRLADPEVQRGVRKCATEYPGANIVLAHCGRCYHPDEMKSAVGAVADLENVYLDTAMVMDPLVLQMVFKHVDSRRVLFATDLPVAAMRGRRVYVMDHWVDLVLEGYPPSEYRVASNEILATFMAWEIVLAIVRAAETAGLSQDQLQAVFHGNGMALLRRVLDGTQLDAATARWEEESRAG